MAFSLVAPAWHQQAACSDSRISFVIEPNGGTDNPSSVVKAFEVCGGCPVIVRSLRELPKGHLHLHLDGAMRPATLRELASNEGWRSCPPGSTRHRRIDRHSRMDDYRSQPFGSVHDSTRLIG
jgi:hypothetical protein